MYLVTLIPCLQPPPALWYLIMILLVFGIYGFWGLPRPDVPPTVWAPSSKDQWMLLGFFYFFNIQPVLSLPALPMQSHCLGYPESFPCSSSSLLEAKCCLIKSKEHHLLREAPLDSWVGTCLHPAHRLISCSYNCLLNLTSVVLTRLWPWFFSVRSNAWLMF